MKHLEDIASWFEPLPSMPVLAKPPKPVEPPIEEGKEPDEGNLEVGLELWKQDLRELSKEEKDRPPQQHVSHSCCRVVTM